MINALAQLANTIKIDPATTLKDTVKTTPETILKEAKTDISNKTEFFSKTLEAVQCEVPSDVLNQRVESVLQAPKALGEIQNAVKECARRVPLTGDWSAEVGNSDWNPDRNLVPKVYNPEGKTWGEILDKYGIDNLTFNDGEPDFSEISEGTVEIEDFSGERNDNFTQADEKLAEKWSQEGKDEKSWTAAEVRAYRKENRLTWHERSDMKTMDLVPSEVHGNIPHSGGISEIKK